MSIPGICLRAGQRAKGGLRALSIHHSQRSQAPVFRPQSIVGQGFSWGNAVLRSVLVVNDSPLIRHAICELFTRDGEFNVCGEAENGHEAIKKAKHLHQDLIVTDLSMSVMNGLEETRLLKKVMPAVPVITYSSCIDLFVERGPAGRSLCGGL